MQGSRTGKRGRGRRRGGGEKAFSARVACKTEEKKGSDGGKHVKINRF